MRWVLVALLVFASSAQAVTLYPTEVPDDEPGLGAAYNGVKMSESPPEVGLVRDMRSQSWFSWETSQWLTFNGTVDARLVLSCSTPVLVGVDLTNLVNPGSTGLLLYQDSTTSTGDAIDVSRGTMMNRLCQPGDEAQTAVLTEPADELAYQQLPPGKHWFRLDLPTMYGGPVERPDLVHILHGLDLEVGGAEPSRIDLPARIGRWVEPWNENVTAKGAFSGTLVMDRPGDLADVSIIGFVGRGNVTLELRDNDNQTLYAQVLRGPPPAPSPSTPPSSSLPFVTPKAPESKQPESTKVAIRERFLLNATGPWTFTIKAADAQAHLDLDVQACYEPWCPAPPLPGTVDDTADTPMPFAMAVLALAVVGLLVRRRTFL